MQAQRSDFAHCEVSVQTLDQEEEENKVDGHDMVLAGLQYSLLVSQEEAAEDAAEAAAAAQDTISRLEQVCVQQCQASKCASFSITVLTAYALKRLFTECQQLLAPSEHAGTVLSLAMACMLFIQHYTFNRMRLIPGNC